MKCTRKTVLGMVLLMLNVALFVAGCGLVNEPNKADVELSEREEKTVSETIKTEEKEEEAPKPVKLSQGEIELKEKLTKIARNNFTVDENTDIDSIIDEMIKYIGTPDSRLRDDLIYVTFSTWIQSGDLEIEQMKRITEELISDDKLRYKIGEVGTDSVFTRSFSVLTLDSILYYDYNNRFLTNDEIYNIYDRLKNYLKDEKDYRGRVRIKGWVHAIAHSGDALSSLAKYEVFGEEELKEMLGLVRDKIVISDYKYNDGEEKRLAAVVRNILSRQMVEESSLEDWVESVINYEKTGSEDKDIIIHSNVKDFLGSLYYSVKHMDESKSIIPKIEEFMQKAD